ncbi:MAG: alpha-mannosidase, partial [Chroococcidiopsidaceae cyanobacterium CP_BM_RX_35]|nr:alpha-mannosidase [Chroococcidiopsidaceae cyanobacterium CP_BM_RX_35]
MTSPTSWSNSNPVLEAIEKLRSCSQVDIQATWRYWADELPATTTVTKFDWMNCPVVQINAKGQIAWQLGQRVLWLAQKLVIPQNLQGYPLAGLSLRLALTWWAISAQIFVNDDLVQEGDLFDHSTRVLLSQAVLPGEEFIVALRLVSPGHDDGALVRSLCVYEADYNQLDLGFVANELAVLQRYLDGEPEKCS